MTEQTDRAKEKRAEALIYCRTASVQQENPSAGTEAQEKRCRKYATTKGYEVAKIFSEKGISGKALDRPGIQALLDHIAAHSKERFVVVVDDMRRIGRTTGEWLVFTNALNREKARIECVPKSPDAEYIDRILAAQNEFDENSSKEVDA